MIKEIHTKPMKQGFKISTSIIATFKNNDMVELLTLSGMLGRGLMVCEDPNVSITTAVESFKG